MRPTPDEVIAGARAILKQEVAPLLPPAAQVQLKRVMAVLRDARWNEAGFDLLRENAAFARLAQDGAARLDRETALPATFAGHADALRAAAEATDHVPASFAEANAVNRQLRAVLSAFIEAVRDGDGRALDTFCADVGATLMALRTT